MARLARIQTAQLLLERPQLIEKKTNILQELQREQQKRQMIQIIFVLAIIFCFFIDDGSIKVLTMVIIGLSFAGYWNYVPVRVLELQQELQETDKFLRMFERQDEKQLKKQQRAEKKQKPENKLLLQEESESHEEESESHEEKSVSCEEESEKREEEPEYAKEQLDG